MAVGSTKNLSGSLGTHNHDFCHIGNWGCRAHLPRTDRNVSSQLCQEDWAAVRGRDMKYKDEPHGQKDYWPLADSPGRLEALTSIALGVRLGVGGADIWPRQSIESHPRSTLTPELMSPHLTWERSTHNCVDLSIQIWKIIFWKEIVSNSIIFMLEDLLISVPNLCNERKEI